MSRSKIFSIAIFLFVCTELLLFLPDLISYALRVLAIGVIIIFNNNKKQVVPLILLSLFILVNFFYLAFDKGHLLKQDIFRYTCILGCIIISQTLEGIHPNDIRRLTHASFVIVAYYTVRTIVIGIEDPMAMRLYTFGNIDDAYMLEQATEYAQLGLISYSNAHMLSCIPPILFFLGIHCCNKNIKIVVYTLALAIIFMLGQMVVTTAFLASLITSMLIIIFNVKSKISRLLIIGGIIVCFIVAGTWIVNIFGDNELMLEKLSDIGMLLSGQSVGQVEGRQNLYRQSIELIYKHPILGLATFNEVGEHSFFLDFYAFYGIFSLIFFGGWILGFKNILRCYNKKMRTNIWISIIPIIILVLTKSSVFMTKYFFATFILIPVIVRYFMSHENDIYYEQGNFYSKS